MVDYLHHFQLHSAVLVPALPLALAQILASELSPRKTQTLWPLLAVQSRASQILPWPMAEQARLMPLGPEPTLDLARCPPKTQAALPSQVDLSQASLTLLLRMVALGRPH
jgi:hypothetical protein